jgi:hypothetical protein
MKVIFGFMPERPIATLYWRDESGDTIQLTRRTDGSLAERRVQEGLYFVITRLSSSQYWMYAAEAETIDFARRYLGKHQYEVEWLEEVQIESTD